LSIESPADRRRTRIAHSLADQIVLKAELLSPLSHDAGLDQLLNRSQQ
jgi:hypothetical protein